MELNTYCKRCTKNQLLRKYDLRGYCPKIKALGLHFTGGIRLRFFTFKELLIKLDIRRKATIWECPGCNSILVECPYCNAQMEGIANTCTNCTKKYYICD